MGCCILLLAFIGCQEGNNVNKDVKSAGGGKGKVPSFLTGVWQTDDTVWQITFEPDGSLKSIKYYFIYKPIVVAEGGGYDWFNDGEIRSVYILGPYSTNYDPKKRWLSLEIKIDYFEIKRPMGNFEGWQVDKFEGTISEDNKTWNAQWTCTAGIKGADSAATDTGDLLFKHISDK
jgi:hypothetical protein